MSPLVRVEQPPGILPLATTVLCLDHGCGTHSPGRSDSCPACGSRSAFPLTRWLNRTPRMAGTGAGTR